jgi:N-acetylmuramoyl-L-alanine amidase
VFYIPEDDILHSHRRENLKSYIALTGWALLRRRDMSPVKYEMGFYIPEDGILNSHRRENLKSYRTLTGWALLRRRNMSPVKYEMGFMSQKTAFFIVTAVKTSNVT